MAEIEEHTMNAYMKKKATKADAATAAKIKGRPASAVKVKAEKVELKVWDGKGARGTPPCPKAEDTTPTDYKSGRIYQSKPRETFRIICERGVWKTEKTVNWEGGKPTPKIWKAALAKIDTYKKGKK